MENENQNSSITILLVICVAVLAIVGLGWFLLDRDSGSETGRAIVDNESTTPAAAPAPSGTEQTEAEAETVTEATSTSGIDADLRKARLAAEADILTDPENQSALYYYGKVLSGEPYHEIANAELGAVLGRLAVTATELLDAERYDEAYSLAQKVEPVRPDHALVNNVQQTLNRISGELVTQAMQLAEDGDNDGATAVLARAEALPGQNRNYFQAVRESMDDLLQAKIDAAAEQAETDRLAAARAVREWMEKVRGAIADGRLIGPDNDNALEFLEEGGGDAEIAGQIRQELYSAILATASSNIDSGDLAEAERFIVAAEEMNGESDEVIQVRATLEQGYISRAESEVLPIGDLVRISATPAQYPRRAELLGISGWVDVHFTVTADGGTADIVVAAADPESVFDKSAIEAVEQWKFEPREYRGKTIAQRTGARLSFRLQ